MSADLHDRLSEAYRLHQAGRLAEAEQAYLSVLQEDERNVDALNLLGVLYVNDFRPDEAVLCISRALKLSASNPESHANIALAYKDQGQLELAAKHFREAIRLDPWQPMVHNNMGNVLREMGQPEKAMDLYERALRMDGGFSQCWSNYAAACHEAGQLKKARRAAEKAIDLEPGLAQAHNNLGDVNLKEARYEEALACYRRATGLNPKYVAAIINMARTLRDMDRGEEARDVLGRALELEPNNPEALHALGVLEEQRGDPEQAAEAFKAAIAVAPGMGIAHYYLAQLRNRSVRDEEFEAMRQLWTREQMLPNDRMFLAFGLARAYEQHDDYDRAYEFIAAGNRIKAEQQPFDPVDAERFIRELAEGAEALVASGFTRHGPPDERPVFVLGMPRSGTSLVEQILASHPEIVGAGELSYAYDTAHRVREMTARKFPGNVALLSAGQLDGLGAYYLTRHRETSLLARRFIDKTPLNFQYIGLLALALPGARFIHCHRDPVQNCFSIHKIPFDKKQAYAHSLDALGTYYNLYWQLMNRWKALFADRILDVRYEDTVADVERQARRMLDFIDVPFDPSVLDFHRSKRLVKTPSASQVRQPIYQDALQSWRRYAAHLQPLVDALDWEALGQIRPDLRV